MLRIVLLMVLLGISTACSNAQALHFTIDDIDEYIASGMQKWQIPGMSVAIVKDGKIVHLKGYGFKSINSNEVVDENTLFQIASITKSFTATTASILHEEGKLSLSDKIVKWLPYFRLKDNWITKEIDLYDLLSHRVGFQSYEGDLIFFHSNFKRESVVRKMSTFDISKKFRSSYGYSNSAYTAVGEIIQRANNKSWEETVREKVLSPLKMDNTMMLLRRNHLLASGHSKINNELFIIENDTLNYMAPAGSMVSSAKDMANWLLAQTNDGIFENEQAIPFKAIKRTRNAYNMQGMDQSNDAKTHFYAYGLGYFVRDVDCHLTYQHSGGISGYSSNHIIVPEEKLGVVVLTNTDVNEFYLDLSKVIIDSYLGLPFVDYSKESLAISAHENLEKARHLDSLRTKASMFKPNDLNLKYTGKYFNDSYGEVEITKQKNLLILKLQHQKRLTGNLELMNSSEFLCSFSHYEYGTVVIPFKTKGSRVEEFTLSIPNFGDGKYIFRRRYHIN